MAKTSGETALARTSGAEVDAQIASMANMLLSDVVMNSEGIGRVRFPFGERNAAMYLVSRLFTDAVFNQDIRAIQLIINRIDGNLPKDTEVSTYQTMFGDCLNEVMSMENGEQLKLMPTDTVMMALCKSLYDIAAHDIYHAIDRKTGAIKDHKPTDAEKKERDAALRMVLERVGGRKTKSLVQAEKEEVEVASWIAELGEGTC